MAATIFPVMRDVSFKRSTSSGGNGGGGARSGITVIRQSHEAKSTASQKQQRQPQRRRRRQQHRCIKWWRMFLGGVGAALYADMHECRRISYPRVPQLGCAMRSGTQEQSRKAINMWRIFIDGAIPSTLSAFRFDNMRYQTKQKEQLVSRFNYAR